MSNSLRSFQDGKLATEIRNGHIFAPKETNIPNNCPCSKASEDVCYKTGTSFNFHKHFQIDCKI